MVTPEQAYEAVGAVHLHSKFSDGSLSIPEIAAIAGETGLDFLMFSDHNTLEPKRLGLEGWYGRVVVIIGCELNDTRDRNHYLAFRIDKEPEGHEAVEYVRQVREAGGFGVIAHPSEKRHFSETYPAFPWTAWDVEGFDGIEIWNQMSEWMEGITRRNFCWRVLHPLRSIRFPVPETLVQWDGFNRDRRVVGLGGIDVHAHHICLLGIPFEIYPYKVQFKSIRTHVLLDHELIPNGGPVSFLTAETGVFDAILSGRCFVSNHSLGDARGFRFWAERDGVIPMGGRIPMGGTVFQVRLPRRARMRLVRDGQIVLEATGREFTYEDDQPGVYRVEVVRKHRGWIYSNPIVLFNQIDSASKSPRLKG
jgi:hypothetical protein